MCAGAIELSPGGPSDVDGANINHIRAVVLGGLPDSLSRDALQKSNENWPDSLRLAKAKTRKKTFLEEELSELEPCSSLCCQ